MSARLEAPDVSSCRSNKEKLAVLRAYRQYNEERDRAAATHIIREKLDFSAGPPDLTNVPQTYALELLRAYRKWLDERAGYDAAASAVAAADTQPVFGQAMPLKRPATARPQPAAPSWWGDEAPRPPQSAGAAPPAEAGHASGAATDAASVAPSDVCVDGTATAAPPCEGEALAGPPATPAGRPSTAPRVNMHNYLDAPRESMYAQTPHSRAVPWLEQTLPKPRPQGIRVMQVAAAQDRLVPDSVGAGLTTLPSAELRRDFLFRRPPHAPARPDEHTDRRVLLVDVPVSHVDGRDAWRAEVDGLREARMAASDRACTARLDAVSRIAAAGSPAGGAAEASAAQVPALLRAQAAIPQEPSTVGMVPSQADEVRRAWRDELRRRPLMAEAATMTEDEAARLPEDSGAASRALLAAGVGAAPQVDQASLHPLGSHDTALDAILREEWRQQRSMGPRGDGLAG